MAQHDYVIANGTGSAVRSDLNNALAAIVSQNSGASEPSPTFAFQLWADTTTNTLKLRNSANSAWIELRQLDGDFTKVSVDNGTAGAPSIYFNASGTDTGFYSSGTDALDFSTAGTRRLGIASGGDLTVYGGNVTLNGQGDLRFADSDSSNWVAFQSPATVSSNVTWTLPSADGTNGQALTTNGSGTLSWTSPAATTDKITEGNTEAEVVDTGSDGHFKVTTEGTERLRINASGNVGIGTTSPSQLLHLNSPSANATQWIAAGTGYTSNLSLLANGSGGGLVLSSVTDSSASVTNTLNAALTFGTNNTERARIDSSGRLLVGTSTATNNIRVNQSLAIATAGSGNQTGIAITNYGGTGGGTAGLIDFNRSRGTSDGSFTSVASGDDLGYLIWRGADGSAFTEAASIKAQVDGTPGANDMPGRLVFSTTADGASSPTERMRITNGGHLYVHNNVQYSSSYTNMIYTGNDNVQLGVRFDTNTAGKQYGIEVNNIAGAANSYAMIFGNGSTTVGSILMQTSSTAYQTTSDYRLKENIVSLTGAIDRVTQLKVRRFNFIIEPGKTVDGFIAHEVQDVVPEAISGQKDAVKEDGSIDPQGIDQSKLVPLLTAALQEAIAKIETLEAKVAALEAS